MKMRGAVGKWGHSLAVRLPRSIAETANLTEGDEIEMHVQDGSVVIRAARPRYDIADLMAAFKPEHRHNVDFGPPVGKEEW